MPLLFQKRSSDAPLIQFLPAEFPGISAPGIGGSHARCTLPIAKVNTLVDSADELQTTLENLFLAGFAGILSRLTRQDSLAIAVGDSKLALFDLSGDCSFREAVGQGALLVDQASATGPYRSELQQVQYEFFTETVAVRTGATCGLRLSASSGGLQLELESPTSQWQEPTLRTWLDHFQVLLVAGAASPNTPISKLPLWEEFSARRFYQSLNRTQIDFSSEISVLHRFERQVRRKPAATAVVSAGRGYTYSELAQRSSAVARELIAAGAKANSAVAVCMERSVDLLVALLAVMKSGAYYVPLDPHNPSQRLQGILEECSPVAILSDTQVATSIEQALSPQSVIPVFRVDEVVSSREIPVSGGTPPSVSVGSVNIDPLDLAYTIYTSGTTGKPKGVRITQNALLNLVCAMGRTPGLNENDKVLAVAPISFDIATMDMFLPICSGATLIIAERSDAVDPFRLSHLIAEHNITCMQATPATWRMLVSSGWTGKKDLKMISGGEALPRELANHLIRLGGELWNCYGPTETTIYSAVLRVQNEPGIVPVGPPMANTAFYVMDRAGKPLPPGVLGELYIGGAGVSPGYVARPELNAERFLQDPMSSNPADRVFCTGDLVRLVNGNVFEFFGRLDHQVKLRGFRIELGEIESNLRSHESIRDAVVVLREDVPGEPRLVAYIICPGPTVGAVGIREFLAKSLPEYMLPSLIVAMDRFPLSASGKINRRELPVPESVPAQIVADHPEATAPVDELETKLLTIFQETLHNPRIGVTDSFFRYGGYSLLSVRLFSRIERELNERLPISLLFDAPTVRQLANVIRKGVSPSVIVPIRPYGRSAPMFVVQSYLLYSAMLEIVEEDRPIYGVREMSNEKTPMTIEERAQNFASEILKIVPDGQIYLAGWCAAGTLTVEIARQLRESGHNVGLVALFDAERPGYALPNSTKNLLSRAGTKVSFHVRRLQRIPFSAKMAYIVEAVKRNWEAVAESYYSTQYKVMMWLKAKFGLSFSETAFHNVYASLATINDHSVRPYPGRLNLFRAADVPDFSEVDPTLGWSSIAREGVEVNFVPGDHVSMFKKPHIASLAYRLQQELRKSETRAVHG